MTIFLNSLLLLRVRDSEGLREILPGPVCLPTMGHHPSPSSPSVTDTTGSYPGNVNNSNVKPPGLLLCTALTSPFIYEA